MGDVGKRSKTRPCCIVDHSIVTAQHCRSESVVHTIATLKQNLMKYIRWAETICNHAKMKVATIQRPKK